MTEIYLCHACSCHEIWRVETSGQVTAAQRALRGLCARLCTEEAHWRALSFALDFCTAFEALCVVSLCAVRV